MARKRKSKKKAGVKIPGSVRRAKATIKKHIAKLTSEKKKQEHILSSTNRELKELKSL